MASAKKRNRAELIAAVFEAGRRVSQASVIYHTKVAERFGLGATDMKVLDLIQSEGPTTPSALADRMGFARASVTAVIDRLEARRLLRRVAHPSDGRRLVVEFDPAAVQTLGPVYGPFFESLQEMVEDYTVAELRIVERAFNDVAARQRAAADQLDSLTPSGADGS
jgi:DNA-binding MarR family transcriptional regulator